MIKNFDPVREEAALLPEIQEAMRRVQESGRYILGTEVKELESEIARYCGTQAGIGVASCTDALTIAFRALGIKEGDEVIVPAYSAPPSILGLLHLKAKLVFCDIDITSFTLDLMEVQRVMRPRTNRKAQAILLVHLFGQAAAMHDLRELEESEGIRIVEDCAQAFGAEYMAQKVGSFGIGCFSFFPTKNLAAQGDGGMITTRDPEVERLARSLRTLGRNPDPKTQKSKEHLEMIGYNSRLDEIQAAGLRVKLKHFEKGLALKKQKAKLYLEMLKHLGDRMVLPQEAPYRSHTWHKFIVLAPNRGGIIKKLKEANIEALPMYDVPLHLHQATKFLGYKEGDFPNSERAAQEIIALPFYTEISESEMQQVAETLTNILS